MAGLIYLKNVVTLAIDRSQCVGCGTCITVCPHEVLEMTGDRSGIINLDACMECGACSRNCVPGAISVETGVGCAVAVINSALGRTGDCCCSLEEQAVER